MASPFSYKNLLFPLGGLDRKRAYQSQPPYTTMDALNVRPYRMVSRRMSGGSRPGIQKWYPESIGGKVNMLALARSSTLKVRAGSGVTPSAAGSNLPLARTVSDDFTGGSLKSHWEALDGCALPFVDDNPPNAKYANPVAAVYKKISAVDADQRQQARMYIGSVLAANHGSYALYLGMDNDSPSANGGISAIVSVAESGTTFTVKLNGTQVYSGTPSGVGDSVWIRVEGNGDWQVSYGSEVMASGASASLPGQRFGFRLEADGEGSVCALDYIEYTYFVDLEEYLGTDEPFGEIYLDNFAEYPVAAAAGRIWRPTLDDKGSNIGWSCINGGNGDLAIQRTGYVMAQQRLRELFIADCGNDEGYKAGGADGTIAVSNGTATLSATGVPDWTAKGIVADNDVVLISDGATGVAEGEYIVSSVATGGITLQGYAGSGGTCTWQVSVSAKVLKPDEGGLEVFMATEGSVPVNCPLICLYRDRLVMAGNPTEPHLWYMSRQGDPYDWNYAEDVSTDGTDYGIAVAGSNADAGVIGQPIRALMPHSDDYLVFGYDTQLWILRGDPASGGQLDCISRTVGVVGKRAWCHGPNGEIYFLSYNGLHRLSAGGSSQPQMISYMRIPVELTGRTYADNIQMSYDKAALGIHIFVEGDGRGWFFSVENESFWPVEFANGANISAMCEYGNGVLMGCVDGFVRVHDDDATTDDNMPFGSYVTIGPVRLGRDDYGRGVLQKLDATMCGSMDAHGLRLSFVFADEPIEGARRYDSGEFTTEEVLRKPVATLFARRSSGCFYVKVGQSAEAQTEGSSWWGMERLGAYIKATGRFRE